VGRLIKNFNCLIVVATLVGCGEAGPTVIPPAPAAQDDEWRFFDREVYFSTGVSVSPEVSAAQEQVKDALRALEVNTDLGIDFFIFRNDDDSLLQPVPTETTFEGRPWYSFVQIWEDGLFNEYTTGGIGTAADPDLVVASNENNTQEFYMLMRLSCFVAGASCQFASQGEARAMVWRGFGYLVGLRSGENAASEVMKAGQSASQEDPEEHKKFFAEFDQLLERLKNGLEIPGEAGLW
jgi:hypothetical protein